jgi:regulator of protease activity HflC (stomatin/prohibitin superfamily)
MSKVKTQIKLGVVGVVLLLLLALFLISFSPVGKTDRGLVTTWGKVAEEIKTPGLHFVVPFMQKMVKYSVIPMTLPVTISIGEDGAITKDNQTIGTSLKIMYAYDPDRLYEAATKFDKRTIDRGLTALTVTNMKNILGQYGIQDIALSLDTIRLQLDSRLKTQIKQYPIGITQVTVENIDWSADFDNRIKATMIAQQAVRGAEQQANRTEQEMRKLKIEAEARAGAQIAEAEGRFKAAELDAKAEVAKAQGRNDANALLQKNLAVEVKLKELEIEKIKWERFNGKFVADVGVMTPSGAMVQLPGVK